ncbi:MaoC/PaaZ C-terminal domain-containing protein [Haloarchaeobius amylolyticus]|uniref:MaoC/PaaZ C-terminal domain-containing protein n=1 Tax=Haloarchaeobius amylolyticus TaxID=1198296 RepID=UPI00226DF482|nr:MaoC/PaaZ C-terminal domain-containing protein [Haloarchaeobius amylolyticus]
MVYSYEPHYFEDMEEGMTFESAGRTVTESDFVFHSMFADDWTELHTNAEYSEEGPFGERIGHGPMTFILTTGMVQRCGFVERTVIAFLGMNYMDVPNPLTIGDTIQSEFEVTETKEFESREDAGLVVIDSETTNQDGEILLQGDMKFMFKRRDFYGDKPGHP